MYGVASHQRRAWVPELKSRGLDQSMSLGTVGEKDGNIESGNMGRPGNMHAVTSVTLLAVYVRMISILTGSPGK